ncbi:hypothetical protein Apa02nite_094360 [Actinoplanes palleronii]|uniref:YbaB/EbfC DNA-binding family protein n=1 Tax=Actinoplanes palleronii TaxID=113570 RepID=A0ABQ4BRN9_9ACTN|nr:hypothetical protein Apa02nite_094360 [Actinoplanes palleronii]
MGQSYSEEQGLDPGQVKVPPAEDPGADRSAVAQHIGFDPDGLQQRLHEIASGQMPESHRVAALTRLLEIVEAIERGIDEVSSGLQATLGATHTGHSPHREVTVTMTGGGELTGVRFDRAWLRRAHDANIGRQVAATFRAAYGEVAAHGVDQLVANSSLGQARRALQDPFELARSMRITR